MTSVEYFALRFSFIRWLRACRLRHDAQHYF